MNSKFPRLLAAFALMCGASMAQAGDRDCGRAASADAECAEMEFDGVQARLNDLLRELKTSLPRREWSHLKESQAYWEKSRSLECHIEVAFVANSPDRDAVKYHCLADHTTDRMHQLRYYLCPRYVRTGQCDAEREYE